MRLFIVTQRDPVFIDEALRNIDYGQFSEVLILNAPNFGRGKLAGLRKFVVLFGLLATARAFFGVMVARIVFPPNVKVCDLPWKQCMRRLEASAVDTDDILLSLSAPHKIPTSVLHKFNTKLNFHSGRLPDYAGMMPMFWQRFNGNKRYTITLHELAEEIDAGDIVFEVEQEFNQSLMTSMVLSKRMIGLIFNMYVQNRLLLSRKCQSETPQVAFNRYPSSREISGFKRRFG